MEKRSKSESNNNLDDTDGSPDYVQTRFLKNYFIQQKNTQDSNCKIIIKQYVIHLE